MISLNKNSIAIEEVWAWKEEIYKKYKDLSIVEMISRISEEALETGKKIKIKKLTTPST